MVCQGEHLSKPHLLRMLDAKPTHVCGKLPMDTTKLLGIPGEGLRRGSQNAPQPCPSSLAKPHVITNDTSEHVYNEVNNDQGMDALGALWFQVHMKLLDTNIPWGSGIHYPRPVPCLSPFCPVMLYFCPALCRDDAPGVMPRTSCFPFTRPASFFSLPAKC